MGNLTIEEVRSATTVMRFGKCLEHLLRNPHVKLIYVCSATADMAEIALILAKGKLEKMQQAISERKVRMVISRECPNDGAPSWAKCACRLEAEGDRGLYTRDYNCVFLPPALVIQHA